MRQLDRTCCIKVNWKFIMTHRYFRLRQRDHTKVRLMMYFVIDDFLSLLFARVISRAWRTRNARAVFIFRKTSRWDRVSLIESAPRGTPRTHEKAGRKRHGLRIIALLYSRSRSYRRTRTRPAGNAGVDTRRREIAPKGSGGRRSRTSSTPVPFENVYHTYACTYIPPCVHDGIEFKADYRF